MSKELVKRELERIRNLDGESLKTEFCIAFRFRGIVPSIGHARKCLAYKVQEKEYGGFSPSEISLLDHLARRDPKVSGAAKARKIPMLPIAGVTYVRRYKGRMYEARANGYRQYEMDGRLYPSLTACVKAITGQHQSGRRCFTMRDDGNGR